MSHLLVLYPIQSAIYIISILSMVLYELTAQCYWDQCTVAGIPHSGATTSTNAVPVSTH